MTWAAVLNKVLLLFSVRFADNITFIAHSTENVNGMKALSESSFVTSVCPPVQLNAALDPVPVIDCDVSYSPAIFREVLQTLAKRGESQELSPKESDGRSD